MAKPKSWQNIHEARKYLESKIECSIVFGGYYDAEALKAVQDWILTRPNRYELWPSQRSGWNILLPTELEKRDQWRMKFLSLQPGLSSRPFEGPFEVALDLCQMLNTARESRLAPEHAGGF